MAGTAGGYLALFRWHWHCNALPRGYLSLPTLCSHCLVAEAIRCSRDISAMPRSQSALGWYAAQAEVNKMQRYVKFMKNGDLNEATRESTEDAATKLLYTSMRCNGGRGTDTTLAAAFDANSLASPSAASTSVASTPASSSESDSSYEATPPPQMKNKQPKKAGALRGARLGFKQPKKKAKPPAKRALRGARLGFSKGQTI